MTIVEIFQDEVERASGPPRRLWFLRLVKDGETRLRVGGWHCRCTAMRLYRSRYSHLPLTSPTPSGR